MFKSFVRTVGLTCLVGVVGLVTEAQGAATVTLKAVAKNGSPIAATNSLPVAPNDTITAEVYFFGWGTPNFDGPPPNPNTGLVQTYQATLLAAAGAISSGADSSVNAQLVLPVGWDAPVARGDCPCPPPPYPFQTCHTLDGCIGPNHTPANGASINVSRPDYFFFGTPNVNSTSTSQLISFRWGATASTGDGGQMATRCSGGSNVGGQCFNNGDCPGGTCNPNFPSYAGTLNLKVGAQVCGTYTFTFDPTTGQNATTFILNPEQIPFSATPIIEPLVLTTGIACPSGACCDTTNPSSPTCSVIAKGFCTGPGKRYGGDNVTCPNMQPTCSIPDIGACCNENTGVCTDGVTDANCPGRFGGIGSQCSTLNPPCIAINQITAVSPTHCTIDARIPFPAGQPAQRRGFTEMILTFLNPPGSGENAANDFQVTQIPAAPAPPFPPPIASVVPGPGVNDMRITFTVPIQPNRWTCVRHIASNSRRCLGFLPADASGNAFAGPLDILTIIDNLNGVIGPLPLNQCDLDRAGTCAAADIITEIDLLNGVNGWPVQNGRTLEACPSTTP